jgi:hypothetical protein
VGKATRNLLELLLEDKDTIVVLFDAIIKVAEK